MADQRDDHLKIFSKIKNRPLKKYFSPEIYADFLTLFESFLEEFKLEKISKTCKDRADDKLKPFLLVSADLSGIQNSVYTISSKGALKSLRARSFLLEFLCEHLCYELITNTLGSYPTYRAHVVFSGGGSLTLLLPNSKDNISLMKSFKKKINNWLFDEFSGKLYVSIKWIEASEADLKDTDLFRSKWEELSNYLEKDKRQKFHWKLSEIFTDAFLADNEPQQRTGREECQICHKDNIKISEKEPFYQITSNFKAITDTKTLTAKAQTEDVVHSLCYHLFCLGDKLTKAVNICRITSKPKLDGYFWLPQAKDDEDEKNVYYTLDKSEEAEFVWSINQVSGKTAPFFFGHYVRKVADLPEAAISFERDEGMQDDHTASFGGLARAACGAQLIGCLRMDVDNLGKIFSDDLEEFNLENLALLSRLLNLFFKVYLNRICAGDLGKKSDGNKIEPTDITQKNYPQNKGRNVSIIYSGGDDLFIAGAWDEISELSFDIQRCFASFSGLGISGAVTLYRPDYPLYQMAKSSEEALAEAKGFQLSSEDAPMKNRVALFYSPYDKHKSETMNEQAARDAKGGKYNYENKLIYAIEWHNPVTLGLVKDFVALSEVRDDRIQLKNISRGFIYKLFRLVEVWWQKNTLYVPEFIYLIERIRKKVGAEDTDHFRHLMETVFTFPVKDNPKNHETIRMLRIPLTWFELLQRSKGD